MKVIFKKSTLQIEELKQAAKCVFESVPPNSFFLMQGALGSGKTTFVSFFCELHNILHVQSPTYAIHNRYQNSVIIIDHFDLYRLADEDEVQASGFYDIAFQSNSYKFIEWSEKLPADCFDLQKNVYKLIFHFTESSRELELIKVS